MEIALPTPLPTPYDIADLPHFSRTISPLEILGAIIFLTLILGIFYLIKRRDANEVKTSIFPAIRAAHERLLMQDVIKKSDTALFLVKVRRARQMSVLLESELLKTFCDTIELQLYGPSFDPSVVRQSLDSLTIILTTEGLQ